MSGIKNLEVSKEFGLFLSVLLVTG